LFHLREVSGAGVVTRRPTDEEIVKQMAWTTGVISSYEDSVRGVRCSVCDWCMERPGSGSIPYELLSLASEHYATEHHAAELARLLALTNGKTT
jgi:hypothetical protein